MSEPVTAEQRARTCITEVVDFAITPLHLEQVIQRVAEEIKEAEQAAKPATIPTRERLPQVGERVLVWVMSGTDFTVSSWEFATLQENDKGNAYWESEITNEEFNFIQWRNDNKVSHWMNVPPAPTSETP